MTGTPSCSGRHWHSARLVPGCLPCCPSADKAQGPLNSGRRRCRRGQRAPAPADAQAATPHWEPKLQPVADAGADTGSRARPPEGQRSGRQTLGAVMAKAPLRRPRRPVPRKSAGAEERTVWVRARPGTAWGRPAAWGRRNGLRGLGMPFVDWVLAESSGPQLGREAVVEAVMERSMSRGGGVEKKHFSERKTEDLALEI